MEDQPKNPQEPNKRHEPAQPGPALPSAPFRPQAAPQRPKAANLAIGTMVHYTHPDPRKDVVDDADREARRAAGALPLQSNEPRVFPATVIRVNDAEAGDISIRVWHVSSSNDEFVANCKPSDEAAGSIMARGRWTPMDRPVFDWTDEERARVQDQVQERRTAAVDTDRGR